MGPSKDDLAAAFYRHLFGLDPSLRELTEQRDTQESVFTKTLTEIVDSMDSFDELVDQSRGLGQFLAAHSIRVSHYATGRAAMMGALEEVLGERFDSLTREAWVLACNLVAECMMAGASQR
jgi:hemoglobin-like flavoprotein